MKQVRLEPTDLRLRVQHSTTEPLRSHLERMIALRKYHMQHFNILAILCLRMTISQTSNTGPEVIKLFSSSTQLSTKFQLLIKTKINKTASENFTEVYMLVYVCALILLFSIYWSDTSLSSYLCFISLLYYIS